ncbi:calcium-binding protein [Rhizobium sp. LjRoot254]|uniref:calcium-binding protein n=1 Tax=Rhizobium sp. LjRoot254 TaxID=3342297 RepID=UPI003ED167A7
MTTTPTVWQAEFTANAGNIAGAQFSPVTIGLIDNRFLTIWVDDTNNIDDDAGTDIIGQIYDAQGNAVGGAFQLNLANFLDNENDPAIAALPDGGFVVVYEDNGTGTGGDAAIRFQRFDASGTPITSGTIVSGSIGGVVNSNPSIAVFANGDFVVSYQVLSAGNTNVFAKIVNGASNVVGSALTAAQNSADVDANPDTIVLSSGNFLTVYEETDSGVGIEGFITTTTGAVVTNVQVANAGTDPHAAALAGGGFVVVWQDAANNGDIRAEIRSDAGGVVTPALLVQGSANAENEPELVALKDGGFFVAWDDDTLGELRGQRFSATGTVIGTTFTIATGSAITDHELGLTDDGRILVTFNNTTGEISQVMLDPRDNVINGDDGSETITSRIDGATVDGNGGDDTLIGQGGDDRLIGGLGADRLSGGAGNDRLIGGPDNDVLFGQDGKDFLFGARGADQLNGGRGRDIMAGKENNDTFIFDARADSSVGNPDIITDFDDSGGNDKIDLSAVFGGVLVYRHNGAFTGAGQVRINDIAGPDVLVEVNTRGGRDADFAIRLEDTKLASMSAGDFIL